MILRICFSLLETIPWPEFHLARILAWKKWSKMWLKGEKGRNCEVGVQHSERNEM